MKKPYDKLIRDRIPEIMDKKGLEYSTRILTEKEYRSALLQKLLEEAHEVVETQWDPAELMKEIADVMEVLDAIITAHWLDPQQIQDIKAQKKIDRGWFEKKVFLEWIEE